MKTQSKELAFQQKPAFLLVLVLTLLTTFFIIQLSTAMAGNNGEPSEKQMRKAVEAKYSQINEHYRRLKRQCQGGGYRQNPLLAMQCIGLYGGSGNTGNISMHLTYFKKIACEINLEGPGYICDYIFSQSSSGNPYSRSIDGMTQGLQGEGKFIHTNNGWVFISLRR